MTTRVGLGKGPYGLFGVDIRKIVLDIVFKAMLIRSFFF